MKLTKLSEPSDIILEQILFGTSQIEQFAILGRAATTLGYTFDRTITDYGIQSPRFLREANEREVSANQLVEMLIMQIVHHNLFGSILDQITPAQRKLLEKV